MIVRQAEERDREALVRLMMDFGNWTREELLVPQGTLWMMETEDERKVVEKDLDKYMAADKFFLVAEDDGELVGFINGETDPDDSWTYKREGKVHNFYVKPEARGRGVGKELLWPATMRWFEEQGCDHFTLNVHKDNPVMKFYEKEGMTGMYIQMVKRMGEKQ